MIINVSFLRSFLLSLDKLKSKKRDIWALISKNKYITRIKKNFYISNLIKYANFLHVSKFFRFNCKLYKIIIIFKKL